MIREILRPTVGEEETVAPRIVAATQSRFKIRRDQIAPSQVRKGSLLPLLVSATLRGQAALPNLRGFHDSREACENVCRMKIIAPLLMRIRAVGPRAIRMLPAHHVERRLHRPI